MKHANVVKNTTLFAIIVSVFAVISTTPTSALTDEQRGTISQNCGTIHQSLHQLQRVDSRTRVYLGTSYETILSSFMTPLVTRLDKNGTPSDSLTATATEFTTTRGDFAQTFTEYQKSLEELVNYDCQSDPDGFYAKLQATRSERANLNQITIQLRALITQQVTNVKQLGESL